MKTITLTEREAALLADMISAQIKDTQDRKVAARARLAARVCGDDMEKRLAEYDYCINQLHELNQLKAKLERAGEDGNYY